MDRAKFSRRKTKKSEATDSSALKRMSGSIIGQACRTMQLAMADQMASFWRLVFIAAPIRDSRKNHFVSTDDAET